MKVNRYNLSRIWLFFLLFPALVLAQQGNGGIAGKITDIETGQPLLGANVVVVGTLLGTTTGNDGRYELTNLPVGNHTLSISYIGYSHKDVAVVIENAKSQTLDIELRTSSVLFDQVIVTGSQQPEDLAQAANSVNTMSHAEILPRGHHMLAGALQKLPAIDEIGENISIRGGSGYSFLSVGGSRVMMLIDGVPMLTSDFSRANWDFLPVTELERVEVLKGGGSVLYGSGGVSGVVNLISRQPSKDARISYRTTFGQFDDPSVDAWKWTDDNLYYYGADLSYSQTFGPIGLRLSASRFFSTGYRQNSQLSRYYLTARPIINFPDGSNLQMFMAYNREERELFFLWRSQNNALTTEYEDDAEVDGLLISGIYNKAFSPNLLTKTRFSLNSQLLGLPLSLTEGFDPALGLSGEFRTVWLPHNQHTLTFGIDYRHDIATSDFFGDHSANTYSPYMQENWKVTDAFQMNLGFRYDVYHLRGDETLSQFSPKFGMSYQLHPNSVVHGSIGRGFRTPSIAERFTEHDIQGAAELLKNPDLKPEKTVLMDLGLRQRINDNVSFEIAGFLSNYENLIELTQVSDINLVLQFLNCEKARILGVESQAAMSFWKDRLSLRVNGTYMKTETLGEDEGCRLGDGEALPYRPEFSAFVLPALHLNGVTLESEYRYQSRFNRVSFFLSEQRVARKTWDLRARYKWRSINLMAQVKNLFNYNYTTVEQNIGELRNFSVSLVGEL